ncbi:hypothetical protein [Ferrovibrio sp.]|uniref:hypothetical protein n=1 Tax=Ferrovibrio sp. TaxID=1917215 RepID=UPI0025BA48FD|nr:hypothetical protein [Ferrovibrio sp.]
MKTDLLVLAGTVLLFAALPTVSHADEDDDRTTRAPLAMGEPMADCDLHHHDVAIAPVAAPTAVIPAVASVKPAKSGTTTQAAPRPLSTAALLTFALIASPGTALPQTGSGSRD